MAWWRGREVERASGPEGLAPGHCRAHRPGVAGWLECRRGLLWVTCAGRTEDWILPPGRRLEIGAGSRVVVQAMGPETAEYAFRTEAKNRSAKEREGAKLPGGPTAEALGKRLLTRRTGNG